VALRAHLAVRLPFRSDEGVSTTVANGLTPIWVGSDPRIRVGQNRGTSGLNSSQMRSIINGRSIPAKEGAVDRSVEHSIR
jgi:hypothetical protein